MAGYDAYSKSNNALQAEREGKMVLTQAVKEARRRGFKGVTGADIKAVLDPCEWHHTSKFYNQTDYYDISELDDAEAADELREQIDLRKRHAALLREMKAAGYTAITVDGEKLGMDIYQGIGDMSLRAKRDHVYRLELAIRGEGDLGFC